MNRIPCFRLVLITATVLSLSVTPLAEARPLEIPQAAHRAVEGWFKAALSWLDNLAGVQHAKPAQPAQKDASPRPPQPPQPIGPGGGGSSTTGGGCIDPQGSCGI